MTREKRRERADRTPRSGVAVSASEAPGSTQPPFRVGVDANYSLGMARQGAVWTWNGAADDLFAGMAKQGVRGFRVRLWTTDDGPYGTAYATEIVRRCLRTGLDPYLVLFLSDDWADLMKQPAPEAWKDLTLDERTGVVRQYARRTVAHFRNEGLRNHLYEIGNEIDYGICGEYPGKSTKKNPETLSRRRWPRAARLIAAGQEGVLQSDPEARFMLHIAHWWDADFCVAFFRFMLEQGIQVDVAGLSYFPSSNLGGSLEMELFGDVVARLASAVSLPVIVAETAYPSTREFKGQFARWKTDVPGYPLTPEGQRCWVSDFLAFCRSHPSIRAVYSWSPEWCDDGVWDAFALFNPDGSAKPAWSAFAAHGRGERRAHTTYLEVRNDRVHVVPVEEAKEQMVSALRPMLEDAGGVTAAFIRRITETAPIVGDYRMHLRAALQKNMDLVLREGVAGCAADDADDAAPEWMRALPAGLDPARERIVFFVRGDRTPGIDRAVRLAASKGFQAVVHMMHDDRPLRFGMCGRIPTEPAAGRGRAPEISPSTRTGRSPG